jgi:uncharacterized RDD family membrane protein YckC
VPVSPGGAPLADFGTRLLAYLIDSAILVAVTAVVAVPAFIIFFLTAASPALDDTDANGNIPPDAFAGFFVGGLLLEAGLFVFVLAVTYLYEVEMMWRVGQTVGKRVMKLRVVPLDPRLRLTRGMAAKRWAVQYAAGSFIPVFGYLDGLWQLWDKPFLQTLHDKAAQTVVIKVSA